MPLLREYKTFISHAWSYNEGYYTVESWLNEAPNFSWKNLSVPKHNPIASTQDLEVELRNQMRPADAFVILAGMYVAHSNWIQFEIDFARRIGRPIIALRPRGAQVMPLAVQRGATEVVGWTRDSLVSAIRKHALPSNR